MTVLASIGRHPAQGWRRMSHAVAVVLACMALALQPRRWTAPVRGVLSRQVLFSGVEGVRFIAMAAALVGLSVVVQTQFWLARLGQTQLVGPMLVGLVIRELAPTLTNLIVIGRSGTAIASEMAAMQVTGEVRVLDAQGIDPAIYLVMPRVLALGASVFSLTVIFCAIALATGYAVSAFLGLSVGSPARFLETVMGSLSQADVYGLLAKTWLPGMLSGAICCLAGLGIRGALTEVPQAVTRSLGSCVAMLFTISALVSVFLYMS